MKKARFALISAALSLLALGTAKDAAADATITITGAVGTSACTVVLNPTVVNLGSHLQNAFGTARTPLAASQQNFSISLDDCQGTVAEDEELSVMVIGSNIPGDDDIFIPSGSSSNVGVRLTADGTPIVNNRPLVLGTAPAANEFTIVPLVVTAALISTAATTAAVSQGSISVPIIFNYLAP